MRSTSQILAQTSSSDPTLVIMAKAPKLGMVKTRLASCLPPPAVLSLYCCLLEDTLTLARSLSDVEIAIVCPASDVDDLTQLTGDAIQVVAQTGDGLAAGLTSVFAHFVTGQRRVIAFNGDSPHLPAFVLKNAFDALAKSDVVIGPTHDGGYYFVGAKSAHPGLFDRGGMGTTSALETLLRRARSLGLSTYLADPFYDIDVASDLIRLAAELRLSPSRAPRTAAWLAQRRELVPRLKTATNL